MKTIESIKATEAVEAINALPCHEWVEVHACEFAGEICVEIIPRFRAHGMKAEHELYCARVAAQADIESLPCVASLVSIGWVSSEGGVGDSFRVVLK